MVNLYKFEIHHLKNKIMWNPFGDDNSSWFAFDYNNPTEQHLAETILRFATAAAPDLFPVVGAQVSVMSIAQAKDLELVSIVSVNGEECYGIFEQQRKFHVLSDPGTLHLLRIYLSETEADRVQQVLAESFTSYRESNVVFHPDVELRVYDQYLPVSTWEFYDATVPDYFDTIVHLQTQYPNHFPMSAQFKPFWTAPLSFSARHELLEARFYDNGRHQRFFLLIDYNEDKSGEMNSQLIDGSSASIHNIWERAELDETVYFKLETDDQLKEYLAVFCWAITGDNGHFILARRYADFPWTDHDGAAWRNSLQKKTEKSWTIVQNTESVRINDVMVAYGDSVFEAAFEITLAQGGVTMVDDVTLHENLSLKPAPFEPQTQQTPQPEPEIPAEDKPEAEIVELPDRSIQARLTDKDGRATITEAEFAEALKTGVLRDSVIAFEVLLDADLIEKKSVEVTNCRFEHRFSMVRANAACSITFAECEFFFGFNAQDICCNGSLHFYDCVFMVYVDQSQLRTQVVADFRNFTCTGGLLFSDCFFWGLASLSNMRVSGDVAIRGCYFATMPFLLRVYGSGVVGSNEFQQTVDSDFSKFIEHIAKKYGYYVLIMDNSRIEGNLIVDESVQYAGLWSNFYGHIKADGIVISGKASIRRTFVAAGIDFCNARFGQDVNFNRMDYYISPQTELAVGAMLDMTNAQVEGSINLAFADVNILSFYGIEVDTNINLIGVRSKSINLNFAEIHGMLGAYYDEQFKFGRKALDIKESIEFHAAKINAVRFEGIYIGKNLIFRSGVYNSIAISYGINYNTYEVVQSEIGGELSVVNVTTQESLNFGGIKVWNKNYQKAETKSGVLINNCKIGGNVLFFDQRGLSNLPEKISHKFPIETYNLIPTEIYGSIDLSSNTIGGTVDLRNTRLKKRQYAFSEIKAHIILDYCKIDRDLQMAGFLEYFDGKNDNKLPLKTFCEGLKMNEVEIGGVGNITGLIVAMNGEFDGSGMKVAGGFYLIADGNGESEGIKYERDAVYKSEITGNFNLFRAKVTTLVMTDGNFRKTESESPRELTWQNFMNFIFNREVRRTDNGFINMEHCDFKKLRMVHPTPHAINLAGIKVLEWDFGENHETARSKNYKEVLEKCTKFDQGVYLDIERDLRSKNHSGDADKIYILMRQKARYKAFSPLLEKLNQSMTKGFKFSLSRAKHLPQSIVTVFEILLYIPNLLWRILRLLLGLISFLFDFANRCMTSYGTTFVRLLILWVALLVVMTAISYDYRLDILADPMDRKPGAQMIFNRDDAFIYAAQNAVPFFELKLIDASPTTTNLRYWFLGAKVAAYILLSFAIVGYSANMARGKQS